MGNLQGLELSLRLYLGRLEGAQPPDVNVERLYSVAEGTEVSVSTLTSYDSLGTLIKRFNAAAREQGLAEIDPKLADVRDTLAHGRLYARRLGDAMHLLKFSKPRNGRVTVTSNAAMTREWFEDHNQRVLAALGIVGSIAGSERA